MSRHSRELERSNTLCDSAEAIESQARLRSSEEPRHCWSMRARKGKAGRAGSGRSCHSANGCDLVDPEELVPHFTPGARDS